MENQRAEVSLSEFIKATSCPLLSAKQRMAIGIGNALEFYDFLTFSFFALQISRTFFPADNSSNALLLSLATFGAGFFTRPLGGIILGTYGDRAGRKAAMTLSFALMGVSILGLALTPSYAQIGLAAPLCLLIFRLLQGFALGGEVGPSTALLIEAAPADQRGRYSSVQIASQGAAMLAAGIVGTALSHWLSPSALQAWGWRVALIVGVAVVPVGLYIRRRLPETWHPLETYQHAPSPAVKTRAPVRLVALSLLVLAPMTIVTYVRGYLTTYAQNTLGLSAEIAFGATVVNGLCTLLASPVAGYLCDRLGRKPVMLAGVMICLAVGFPGFALMNQFRSAVAIYAVTAILATAGSLATVAALVAITESLPTAIRSGALSTIYAVAITVFGGTAQFIIQWLIDFTGSPLAPAWYMTVALVMGGIGVLMMRETAPLKAGLLSDSSK